MLVNLWAQWALDVFQVVVSAQLLLLIWPLEVETMLVTVAKFILLAFLVVVGIAVPSLLAIMFIGYKANLYSDFHLSQFQVLVAVLAISAGVCALLLRRSETT